MRSCFNFRRAWLACLSLFAFAPLTAIAAPEPNVPEPSPAEQQTLVSEPKTDEAARLAAAALEAHLAGKVVEREELLEQSIEAAPDFAPARWQRGEILEEGKWRSLASVQERLAKNPHRDEYLQLRDSSPDTPVAHVELARWCMRNGLANEERFHWTKVLFADPRHELALSRLELKPYRGGLYTKQEIADFETKQANAKADLKKYRPIFAELCRSVTTSDTAARQAALATLGQVDDIAKLPALVAAIHAEASQSSPEDAVDLYLALIDSLSQMPERQATLTLLNLSLLAEHPHLRQAAALGLKPRPVTDYVPQLMAAMTKPINGEVGAEVHADGSVTYAEILYQEGPLADRTILRKHTAVPLNRGAGGDNRRDRVNAAAMAQQRRQRLAMANAQAVAGNTRVREVLNMALNFDLGDDPQKYWDEWTKYNELEFDEHPLYSFNDLRTEYIPTTHSCFMEGTPVWTQEGMRPIETIAVGDMVLAQHPETGEIAFRPVLEKTLGPPTQTVAIGLPNETIVATLGHRFWVEQRGWEMAKVLEPEMYLHAITTSLPIESLDPGQRLRCHNMVVEGFHTYFVGRSQVLVHDKTCPQPTTSKTPGHAVLVDALATAGR